ncbi:hypothetical protein [Streptomyces sp. NPDC051572]|uniref:hypothetical protein n=1 Tax=Streptomyces sp. NPDC051572 TaxID=3155802 RepID=UPI00344CA9C1
MMLVPVRTLAVEATMLPDTPQHVLDALERTLLADVRREHPGAAEYRSTGWADTVVPVPEDELLS